MCCLNQENLIFFSFFSSELHKVAYQGWHVCDITCGVIRHNLFGQVDSNLVMIYRTWFWSLLPGLARLVNLGEIEYNSDFFVILMPFHNFVNNLVAAFCYFLRTNPVIICP